jgi:RND family efflux transporter MFP subunit
VNVILQQSKVWMAGLAVVGLAACQSSVQEHPEAAAAGGAPVELSLGPVAIAEWPSSHEAGGVVRPRQTAVLSSRIVAPVLEVRVNTGDPVRRGQALVVLDGRELQANAQRATAAASGAKLGLQAAQAEARAAESALTLARLTHERVRGLTERKSATQQELDEATAVLAGAEARVAGAQARVAEAEQGIAATAAAREAASVGASYTVLTAPFDGIVAARQADPGSLASPGTPLLIVDDTTAFRLEARIDEAQARLVQVGSAAQLRLDAASSEADDGWQATTVSEVAQVDPASHSFLVKFDLPTGSAPRAGQFGRARILGPARRVLAVPGAAVVRRGQLSFTYVVDGAGAARLRMVSVGEPADGRIEVLAGLQEGDRVVLNPPSSLQDGTTVRGASRADGDSK